MRCRKVQRMLSVYIDSELTEEAAAVVSEHLSECPRCATEREKLLSFSSSCFHFLLFLVIR